MGTLNLPSWYTISVSDNTADFQFDDFLYDVRTDSYVASNGARVSSEEAREKLYEQARQQLFPKKIKPKPATFLEEMRGIVSDWLSDSLRFAKA